MELFGFHLVVLPEGHGARFYHIVWPFYAAILISPYHGDLEKARMQGVVGQGRENHLPGTSGVLVSRDGYGGGLGRSSDLTEATAAKQIPLSGD